jgi:hypothetical protein
LYYFRIIHSSNFHPRRLIRIRLLVSILGVIFALGSSLGGLERLLEVCNDIVNVLNANRNPDQVLSDSTIGFLFVAQLLVSGAPRICRTWISKKSVTIWCMPWLLTNCQCLCITNIGKVGYQLEAIDNLTASIGISFNSKRKHTSKTSR